MKNYKFSMVVEGNTYEELVAEAKSIIRQVTGVDIDNNNVKEQPINVTINFNYDKSVEHAKDINSRLTKLFEEVLSK